MSLLSLRLFSISFCIDYELAYYTFSGDIGDSSYRNQYPTNSSLKDINPSAINSMTDITAFWAYSFNAFLPINSFCYPLASNNGDVFVLSRNTSDTFLYLVKFNSSLHLQNNVMVTDMMSIYNNPHYPIYYFNKGISLIIVSCGSSGMYIYDTMDLNLIWSISGFSVKQPIIYENYIFYSLYQNINDSAIAFYGVNNVENGETLWQRNGSSLYYDYLTSPMIYDQKLYINETLNIQKPILIQIYAETELIGYDLMNGDDIKSDIFNKYNAFKSTSGHISNSYKFVLDSMSMKMILYSLYNLYIVDFKYGTISSDLLNIYETYSTKRRLTKCLLNGTNLIAVYYIWLDKTEIRSYDTRFLYKYQNNLTQIYTLGDKLSGSDYSWSPNVYFMDHHNYIIALNKYHVTYNDGTNRNRDFNKYVIYNEQFEIENLDTYWDQPSYDLPSQCPDTYPIIHDDILYFVYGSALIGLLYQYTTTTIPTKYPTHSRLPTSTPIQRETSNEHRDRVHWSTDVTPILVPILICVVLIGVCLYAIYNREKLIKLCKQKHIVRYDCTSCTNGKCERKRTCNLCNGTGKIYNEIWVTNHKNEGVGTRKLVTCTKCEGIGEHVYLDTCFSCNGRGYHERTHVQDYKVPLIEMK